MRYLLDTNVVIRLTANDRAVRNAFQRRLAEGIGVSSMVAFELYYGAFKSKLTSENLSRIDGITLTILDFDRRDAREAGQLRAKLQTAGKLIGSYDLLIAGQALARNLILVTHNTAEFARVPGLRLEDWQA